jgi:hypothetical protein
MAAGSISSFRARSHESGSSYFQSSVFGGEFHEVKQGEVLAQEPWGRYHQPEDWARRPSATTRRACEPDGRNTGMATAAHRVYLKLVQSISFALGVNGAVQGANWSTCCASPLADQARSRDYDPSDKRGQAGK